MYSSHYQAQLEVVERLNVETQRAKQATGVELLPAGVKRLAPLPSEYQKLKPDWMLDELNRG
jgi:hypothetical protein